METEREMVSLSYAFWSRHFPPPFYVDYHYKKIRNGWWHIMLTLCSLNVKNILNWATKMQALGNWHQECDSRSPQGGESSLFQSCTVCCSISFFNTSNDGKLKVPWDPNKSMAKCSLKLTVVNLTERMLLFNQIPYAQHTNIVHTEMHVSTQTGTVSMLYPQQKVSSC